MPGPSNPRSKTKEKRKYCHCKTTCGELLTARRRRDHYAVVPTHGILPSEDECESENGSAKSEGSLSREEFLPMNCDHRLSGTVSPNELDPIAMDVDANSSCGSDDDSVTDESDGLDVDDTVDLDEWKSFDEREDREVPISREEMIQELEEMLGPDEEAELWDSRNEVISERDRDDIRAFRLKMLSNMPRIAFEQMRHAFRHKLEISSHWVMIHRIAMLSSTEPVWHHCCPNSCMAYTGEHVNLERCKYCQEPRLNASSKPRRLFCYLPIIPRLQGFFLNPKKIEQLLYRHNYQHVPGTIADVFDGEHYKNLRTQKVVVDGKELSHRYFSGKYDIALGVCTDSYLLFERRRKGPSATPILVENYAIPPNTRTHLEDLMCTGIISGPNGPKDARSYLVPLDDELARLAVGVPTYNCVTRSIFALHAYNLFTMGDIIAIEKLMNIKGHNSLSACRSCKMKGLRNVTGGEKIYYMPLATPSDDGELRETWDPRDLPLRTDESFQEVVNAIDEAILLGDKEKLAKYHGIKGLPALRRVGSMDRARSNPWDCMHLFFENLIPNLVKHWSGKFKGLDAGREDYEISEEVWAEIWKETADAMKDIPSDFSRSLAAGPGKFTAEAWCFWFVYLAPGLLKGRFSDPKYHVHACELSEIIKSCLQFTSTLIGIDILEEKIVCWVEDYEKYYYQYAEERLCACPLTVHGLLHVCSDMRFCGPSWTTWTFFMERYCGFLKRGLRSKRFPWANLNNRVLNYAYMEQIGVRYDLSEELSIFGLRSTGPSRHEHVYENYPQAILRTPYQRSNVPDNALRHQIANYFCDLLGKRLNQVLPLLPEVMPRWGKVRIVDGDSIKAATTSVRGENSERSNSYVRFEIQVKKRTGPENKMGWVETLCYGRLEQILVCKLPVGTVWGAFSGQTRLLAVLTPCSTGGKDATQEIVSYTQMNLPIVTDLQSVSAVIGRVETRGKYVIIDRTGGLIKPEFVPSSEMEEGEGEEA